MLELRILGSLDLRAADGEPVSAVLAQPKRVALLAYLALEGRSGLVRRDLLLATFWPEADGERGRASLRRSLHFLRGALGADAFEAHGDAVRVSPESLRCDAVAFETALDVGDLAGAVALYRGDLLAGLHLRDATEFEHWLERERSRLRARAGEALWTLAERALAAGVPREAAAWSDRAVSLLPYDEGAQRRRITLLLDAGDHAGALRAYEEFAAWLAREYDGTPSAETRGLAERLREVVPAVPPGPRPSPRQAPPAVADLPIGREEPDPGTGPVVEPPPSLVTVGVEPAPAVRPSQEPAAVSAPGLLRDAPPRPARRRRLVWLGAAAVATVAAVGVALLLPRLTGTVAAEQPVAAREIRVAVLPFAVHGDARLHYLGEGMVDLLSTQLDGAGPLRIVDPHALLSRLPTLEAPHGDALAQGRAASAAFDAGLFVAGSVVQAGDRLQLRATLYDRGGAIVATASAGAPEAELSAAVDELGRQLLIGRYEGPAQQLARLAVRTSASPAALRAYLAGTQLLRDGRFGEAGDAFRAAIAADSGFALAYHGLSLSLGWLSAGGDRAATEAAEAAVERAERLGPRVRNTLRAHHASWNGRPAEAERLYRDVLAAYPDDVDAQHGLAEVLFHEGAWTGRRAGDAAGAFERVAHVPAFRASVLLHLMRIAALEQDSVRLDSLAPVARRELDGAGPDRRLLEVEALWAFTRGDQGARRVVLAEVAEQADAQRWQLAWSIARHTGQWAPAEGLLAGLTAMDRAPATRATAWLGIATLRAAGGRPAAARAALRAAARDDPRWAALVRADLAALPFLRAPRDEAAQARRGLLGAGGGGVERGRESGLPAVLDGRVERLARDLALVALDRRSARPETEIGGLGPAGLVRGTAPALERERAGAELAELRAGWEEMTRARAPFLLAAPYQRLRQGELLAALGQAVAADGWYASVPTADGYDVALIAPSMAARARLAEAEGRHAEAARLYERFAALWAACEPELRASVTDARLRAAELRREGD